MSPRFLGLPMFIWGFICLAIAIVWVVIWPQERTTSIGDWRYLVLRWFHALTWLLLATASFVVSLQPTTGQGIARLVALLGLLVYVIFMVTFIGSRPVR
jgi:hypothetical protein